MNFIPFSYFVHKTWVRLLQYLLLTGSTLFRDFKMYNEALLGKWLWRFMNGKSNIWGRVMCTEYDEEGFGWSPTYPNGPYGLSLWR